MNKWRVLLDPGSNDNGGGGGSATTTETPTLASDPLMVSLFEDLKEILPSSEGTPQIKAAEEKSEDDKASQNTEEKKPEDAAANPKPDESTAVKAGVKKREDPAKVAERVVNEKLKNLPAPQLPEKPKVDDKPAPSLDELSDEQRAELADAEFAEKEEPEKWKGFKDKLQKFYKEAQAYVDKHKDDPDRTFDENDQEFVAFIKKNKPSWGNRREDIRISRLADERAERKLAEREKKTQAEIDKANQNANEAKVAPIIKSAVESTVSAFDSETKTEDPLEAEIYDETRGLVADASSLYLGLLHGTQRFDPQNQNHAEISRFIVNKGDEYAADKSTPKVRDGKKFVTPTEHLRMQKENDPKLSSVWTFGKEDVLKLIKDHCVSIAKQRIQTELEKAQKRGFVKQKPAAVPKQADPVKPVSGPKAAPTPSPGPAEGSKITTPEHPGQEIIETLGLLSK